MESLKTLCNADIDATILNATSEFRINIKSPFNRKSNWEARTEYRTFKGNNEENNVVLNIFRGTTKKAFRKDQILILENTTDNKFYIYKNRDFDNPKVFSKETDVLSFLIPTKVDVDSNIKATNMIYFGSPGTGKSNTVDEITKGHKVFKTTFHPEYDYHSFVGGYKPSMEGKDIVYKFVPQIFTKIYVEAWKNQREHYYLQIEEINRGNCAEIFGDLFQLLDRNNEGASKYPINAEEELRKHLILELKEGHKGIIDDEIRLPSNLSIIATMNTSDQSLFPMDSAFKRRWDWEYIPIKYKCDKSDFTIKIDDNNIYDWLDFLKAVNEMIVDITDSPDKQIGNWFINANYTNKMIDKKTFINKVLFYLWNDIFKDEEDSLFFIDNKRRMYEDFFIEQENSILLIKMLEENLQLEKINAE